MFLETLIHQNRERSYYIFVPDNYQPERSTPLLLVFHGGVGQGNIMAIKTGFNEIAEQDNFIVVYPNGIKRDSGEQWNDGRNLPDEDNIDDISFVTTLIEQIQQSWNINQKKIYAVGGSNGGFFTQRLACEIPDIFAAAASVSATLAKALQSRCQTPIKAIPLLMINGTHDKLVPWRGGSITIRENAEILSVPETIEFWRIYNNCFDDLTREIIGQGKVVKTEYFSSNGDRNLSILHYAIRGAGHGWPGSNMEPILDNVTTKEARQFTRLRQRLVGSINQDINASQIIWEFFQNHSL
jgi:polyhydroxybutyrate depolymerase